MTFIKEIFISVLILHKGYGLKVSYLIQLQEKYNWFLLPLSKASVDKEKGVKSFIPGVKWKDYDYSKTILDLIDDDYFRDAKGLAFLTGKKANLLILDCDTEQAFTDLKAATGLTDETISNLIVKTIRGYHLHYLYEDELPTSIGFLNHLDILSNDRLCFGVPSNEGYSIYKDGSAAKMPQVLKKYLLTYKNSKKVESQQKIAEDVNNLFNYEVKIGGGKGFSVENPLAILLENYLGDPKNEFYKQQIQARLLAPKGFSFATANTPGTRHTLMMSLCGHLAYDVSVDENLYENFLLYFLPEIVQPDDDDPPERLIRFNLQSPERFKYDETWRAQYESYIESLTESQKIIQILRDNDWFIWEDVNGGYRMMNIHRGIMLKQGSKAGIKELICKVLLQEKVEFDLQFVKKKFDTIYIPVYEKVVHSPMFPFGEQRILNRDEKKGYTNGLMLNTFIQSKYQDFFSYLRANPQMQNKNAKIPKFIGKLLDNIIPDKRQQVLALHNIAYHMHTKKPFMNAICLLGNAQGTGKTFFIEKVLAKIIGDESYVKLDGTTLNSNFNGGIKDKLLICFNEVSELRGNNRYTLGVETKLKNFIAEEKITLHVKGQDDTTIDNHSMVFITSNDLHPFDVSADSRRFNFFATSNTPLRQVIPECGDPRFYEKYIEPELNEFVAYLASIKLDDYKYAEIIKSELFTNAVEDSTNKNERIVDAILNKDFDTLDELTPNGFCEEMEDLIAKKDVPAISKKLFKEIMESHNFYKEQAYTIMKIFKRRGLAKTSMYLAYEKRNSSGIIINAGGECKEIMVKKAAPPVNPRKERRNL